MNPLQLIVIFSCVLCSAYSLELQKIKVKSNDPFTGKHRFFYFQNAPKATKKHAALISLHGFGSNAKQMMAFDGFLDTLPKLNIAVAYGQSIIYKKVAAWNTGDCCDFATNNNKVDDTQYVKEIIKELTESQNVDPKRVFVTGWSSGGELAFKVACQLGDKIRGIAPYAGALLSQHITMKNSAGKEITATNPNFKALGKDIRVFAFKKSVTASDWLFKFNSVFKCTENKVAMLIINGKNDILENPAGSIFYNNKTKSILFPIPPLKFAAWNLLNLNKPQRKQTFTSKLSDFTKELRYDKTIGKDSAQCYQYYNPDDRALLANITICSGTGGHIWWGSEKRVQLPKGYLGLLGPYNKAFDVSHEVTRFICANGAQCTKKGWPWLTIIVFGALILVLLIGSISMCIRLRSDGDPSDYQKT